MNDKPTLDERLAVGGEAARLLEDPLFNAVLNTILKNSMADLVSFEVGSREAENEHAMMKGMGKIKSQLRVMANDAVMARKELEKEQRGT